MPDRVKSQIQVRLMKLKCSRIILETLNLILSPIMEEVLKCGVINHTCS